MSNYCTLDDITLLVRNLTPEESDRAEALIPLVSNCLRHEAYLVGEDIDNMIEDNAAYADVVKSVTIDVVMRYLNTSTTQEPMSQMSQSAMGYTVSGTYLVAGGGLFIKESEKKRLGLKTQKAGAVDIWQ